MTGSKSVRFLQQSLDKENIEAGSTVILLYLYYIKIDFR